MLTKAKIKLIKSLHEKKYRNEYGLFLVEGEKSVKELLKSNFKINYILGTKKFFDDNADILKNKTSPSVIPAEAGIQSAEFESTWIQEYFFTKKFPGHTSARQPPVLRKRTHAFSPAFARMTIRELN